MRLREVVFQARDPRALAAWYRDALDLVPAPGEPAGVRVGASALRFEEAPPGVAPRYHFAFNVPEDRIGEALAWLRPRAPIIESDEGPIAWFEHWDAHAVYFADSAGNIGELIARHTLPSPRAAGPFGGHSLLEVSEVGLPCPDVPALAAELSGALGVPAYRLGSERFVPLGDERGLLILVREGREWFPTRGEARTFPVRVRHDGGAYEAKGLPYRFLAGDE
jgi:hypothetical protein